MPGKMPRALMSIAVTIVLCLCFVTTAFAVDFPLDLPDDWKDMNTDGDSLVPQGTVLCDTKLYIEPDSESEVAMGVRSGQTLEVHAFNINDEWNAVTNGDGEMLYIKSADLSVTAPSYVYEYLPNMSTLTGFTAEQLEKYLRGGGLEGLGDCYARMESEYGVNALFLICINKYESANGNSRLARANNNLGGIKDGRGGFLRFESREACVEHLAKLLRNNYISEDGRYYRGKTSKDISYYYCEQSESWYQNIENMMNKGYNIINNE